MSVGKNLVNYDLVKQIKDAKQLAFGQKVRSSVFGVSFFIGLSSR